MSRRRCRDASSCGHEGSEKGIYHRDCRLKLRESEQLKRIGSVHGKRSRQAREDGSSPVAGENRAECNVRFAVSHVKHNMRRNLPRRCYGKRGAVKRLNKGVALR